MSYFDAKKYKNFLCKAEKLFLERSFVDQCILAGLINITMSRTRQSFYVARHIGVDPRTARRWLDESGKPHPAAVRLLLNFYMGFPQQGRWRGWQITDDYLVSPTGETLTPDMIGKLWLWRNERRMLQSKIAELQAEIDRLKLAGNAESMDKIEQAVELLRDATSVNLSRRRIAG